MFVFQYNGMFQWFFPGEKYPDKILMEHARLGSTIDALKEHAHPDKVHAKHLGLDSMIGASKERNLIGQMVVVVFDNTYCRNVSRDHDYLKRIGYNVKSVIGEDLVKSTIRQGVLKEITRPKKDKDLWKSSILFEEGRKGSKALPPIQTSRVIDIIPLEELAYPTYVVSPDNVPLEELECLFRFFYFGRGRVETKHYNPLGAFLDGRVKVLDMKKTSGYRKYIEQGFSQAFFSYIEPKSSSLAHNIGSPETCSREYEKELLRGNIPSQRTYVIRCGRRGQ